MLNKGYNEDIPTNHVKEILEKKHVTRKKFVEYAKWSGISESTSYKILDNLHCNMQETTVHKLQKLLNVPYEELISWSPDMDTYFNDNPRGFTKENLAILSSEMKDIGIKLRYQVYSRKGAMNVTTMYARNRRMYLDGNFRIDTSGLPELWLTSFDVVNNRLDTTSAEQSVFYLQLLQRTINFARKIGVYQINYAVCNSDINDYYKGPAFLSPKRNIQICTKLGFQKSNMCDGSSFCTRLVKVFNE